MSNTAEPLIGLFPTGRICISKKLAQAIIHRRLNLLPYVVRHINGDWGAAPDHQRNQNDGALKVGGSIHSAYYVALGITVLITTEADRSVTTLTLAEEDLVP